MRKILFTLIIILSLTACKKNKVCWNCQIVNNGVITHEKKCDNGSGRFKDDNGNDLQCIEIH